MNNRVTITFSRNFVAGDSIGVYYSDPSTQTSGYWTFTWVSGTPGTFQVQIGTPTTTTGEIEAIRFASAWTNSLNGFTVTQPVGGNDNQVQITSQTYHFVNVLAKFSDGSTMAIPTDYSYVLSTVSTGNKITYTDKEPLNTPTAPAINLWKADDANEVKTKFNLNDDRIGTNETDIAANTAALTGKADLVGGNDFTGDQTIDGNVGIGTENPTEKLDIRGNVKIGKVGVSPYLTFDENPDISSGSEFYLTHDIDGNILKFTDDNSNNLISMDRDNGNVGVGTTTPSEKLEVVGNIKSSGNVILNENSRVKLDVDVDDNSYILHDGTNVYASANDHKFIQGSNGNYAEVHTGNLYEHFTITSLSTSNDLSDTQRVLQYSLASNGTLDIPDSLDNKVWEIFVTGTQLTVQPKSGSSVTLSIVHNGQSNDGVISQQHSAKLIRTATNGYTLIKY